MPIFGTPPARMSSLVVDADLDMGAYSATSFNLTCKHTLQTDIISHYISGDISFMNTVLLDMVAERTTDAGVSISDFVGTGKSLDLSDTLSVGAPILDVGTDLLYSDGPASDTFSPVWSMLKEVVIPPEYVAKGVTLHWEGKTFIAPDKSVEFEVRINNVPRGRVYTVTSGTYVALSENIYLFGAPEIHLQIWGHIVTVNTAAYVKNMEVRGNVTAGAYSIGGAPVWP
ncbi:hypothetical protein ES708_34460 [subsurface metagenome]